MSDMHLDPNRPDITQLFIDYLSTHGPEADAVYLLGDIFEVWLGDNVSLDDHQEVISCLKALSKTTPVYSMRGNRDFLLGKAFEAASGTQLLNDPQVVNLYDTPTLITHGDLLCTDDVNYQRYRKIATNKLVQWLALNLIPNSKKRKIAADMRAASKRAQSEKTGDIMDVNNDEVMRWFTQHNVARIIHGHTHRPGSHEYANNQQRWVLGDWYTQGSVLRLSATSGPELLTLNLG